ncbi:hypothetical protein ACFS07_18545 [Undibacterium arcticum]
MQVQRIERIGLRLFGVASCIVSFGDASAAFAIGERSMGGRSRPRSATVFRLQTIL